MYYRSEPVSCEEFLQYLDKLPWCKQGDSTLIAVHHCSPEVIEVIKHHDLKVYPGGLNIKLTRSTLSMLETKYKDEEPVPLLLVWKTEGIEMSFRKYKSAEFPYDIWQNPAAAAYERESVFIMAEELGDKFDSCYKNHLENGKSCSLSIPPH